MENNENIKPSDFTMYDLAVKVKEMRDLQKAYFASGGPRYRDKKLLAASKDLEGKMDQVVDVIISTHKKIEVLWEDMVQRFDNPAVITKNAIWDDEHLDIDPYA